MRIVKSKFIDTGGEAMTLIDLSPTVRRSPRLDSLPVAIIGAGPVGLAAAANLVERGIDFVIYESGATPCGEH